MHGADSSDDSLAMLKLAEAITPTPAGWSTNGSTNYCNWSGVQCTMSLRVNAIVLPNRALTGILPPQLSSLTDLRILSLQNNRLSGPLPSLANLSSLQELRISSNKFTGIPETFFSGLFSLRVVSIGRNRNFEPWTIPSDIAQCTSLTSFEASEANIMGSIPDIFASLPNIRDLKLSHNNLTGTLPGSFANSGINNLWLNSQQIGLSGSIDVLSSMIVLTQAWLHGNQFTGPIPDLSKCTDLFDMQLRDNLLTGTIPASLISLPGLSNVSLLNNRLLGPVPEFKTNVVASFGGNNFCVGDPGVPCDPQVTMLLEIAGAVGFPPTFTASWRGNDACRNWMSINYDANGSIVIVNFARQSFSGFISSAFGNLTSIRKLYLNDNNLTGVLPDSLTKLPQLEVLDVSNNNLSGNIPIFASTMMLIVSPGNPYLSAGEEKTNGSFSATGNRGKQVLLFIISAVVVTVISFSALVVYVFFKCKRKKRPSKVNNLETGNPFVTFPGRDFDDENVQYSIELLKQVTNNFNENNVIGKGGFGMVYKGKLQDGTEVAVKRMKTTAMSKVGETSEFQAEISVLLKVRHRHLISLLGNCESGDEGFLIYEYMPKGTLKQHLFDWHELGWPPLTWKQRLRIALDVARGLEYLHNLTEQSLSFIHRDIKPSNILLGDDMRAKISDFGLVKKSSNGLTSVETRVAGTFGYLAPEYAETGKVTKTVDVYAFGAILMEMITGRKAIDDTKELEEEEEWMEIHLVTWFTRVVLNNDIYKEIDRVLNPDEEDLDSIYKVAELSVKCTDGRPRKRPDIGCVVNVLVPLVEQWRVTPPTVEETVSRSISTLSDERSVDSGYYANEPLTANWQQKHATI